MGSVRAAVSTVLHVGNVLGVGFVCNNSLDSSTRFSVYIKLSYYVLHFHLYLFGGQYLSLLPSLILNM